MSSFRLAVIYQGQRREVETSLEEFTFFSLLVGARHIDNLGGNLRLEGPVVVGPAADPTHAMTLGQLAPVQALLNGAMSDILVLREAVLVARLMAARSEGNLVRHDRELTYLRANRAKEDVIPSGLGGQTVFNTTSITFEPSNLIPDIAVFVGDRKQIQDTAGGTTFSFRKLLATQIEFSETIPEGVYVTIRLDGYNFVNAQAAQAFFRNYVTLAEGVVVPVGSSFDIATGKLQVYRNGLLMVDSPITGVPVERYSEKSLSSIELGVPSDSGDLWSFYHINTAPSFKVAVTGLAGTLQTVSTYATGTKRLRVFRNGILMNAQGFGDLIYRYVETSSTSITLAAAANLDDTFTFDYAGVAPQWRNDLTGITGLDVDFDVPYVYVPGDKRLQVWRNGVLMCQSLIVGDPVQQYVEDGVASILLTVAAVATDVFTAIYL